MEYYALFDPAAEGGFVINFPDFGWGVSEGDTEQEAREMAAALLETLIAEHIRKGEPLPRAAQVRGRKYRLIRLPVLQATKAELYSAFRASGLKKVELARRLGIPKTNVDRLFDFKNHTRLDQLEAAFTALDKRVSLVVQNAA
ncbi:MAG: type II toxin-antitoxin system HicB family antitoxin [Bryobacteraceae bacterium]